MFIPTLLSRYVGRRLITPCRCSANGLNPFPAVALPLSFVLCHRLGCRSIYYLLFRQRFMVSWCCRLCVCSVHACSVWLGGRWTDRQTKDPIGRPTDRPKIQLKLMGRQTDQRSNQRFPATSFHRTIPRTTNATATPFNHDHGDRRRPPAAQMRSSSTPRGHEKSPKDKQTPILHNYAAIMNLNHLRLRLFLRRRPSYLRIDHRHR